MKKSRLIELYIDENLTQREVADRVGFDSASSVGYYCRKYGVSKSQGKQAEARLRTQRWNIVEERAGSLEQFKQMAAEADSVSELSRRIDTKREVVYNLLDEFGIDFTTRSERLARVTEDRLRQLYHEQNMSQQQVADELDVSRGYIQDQLTEHDIETTPHSEYDSGPDSHGPETRRKMRLSAIERIREADGQLAPRYNKSACETIDWLAEREDYDFQHAENGGEFYVEGLGYWLDGYDSEANVAVEVDEPRHFEDGELRGRDRRRQREITEELDCDFIRIRANEDEPYIDTR